MKTKSLLVSALAVLVLGSVTLATSACGKKDHDHDHDHSHDGKPAAAAAGAPAHKHEHIPPHGGTAVVLGEEAFHVELVRDAATGVLQAYVLDGELENFVRVQQASFDLTAKIGGETKTLTFKSVANSATGETVGDTSLFTAEADWLKTTSVFDAEIKTLTVRSTTFTGVKFNFPKGNDSDDHDH